LLAGGQTLMPVLAMRLAEPEVLIDLGRIENLRGIALEDDALRLGAMTRYVDLERSALVAEHAPLITRALPYVAHVAIRNRGTIGGSVALADPAAEMPACMLALGAEIELTSTEGNRWIAAEDYFLGLYETAREDTEILTAIRIPLAPERRVGFYEVARRHGDYALAGAAAVGDVEDGRIQGLRVAMFGCDDLPVLAKTAAKAAETGVLDGAWLEADVSPTSNINGEAHIRLAQARVAFRRAVTDLLGVSNG
jgi:aerobic carbon-monoxide dehydrogenase medium subunit